MLFKKECKVCKQKDKEIQYLRELVDNLLVQINVQPVVKRELEEDFTEPKAPEGEEEIG